MTVSISVKLLPRFCHYKLKLQGYLMERKKHIQIFFVKSAGALKDQCAPRSFSENFALRAPTKDRALRSAERKSGAQVPSSANCITVFERFFALMLGKSIATIVIMIDHNHLNLIAETRSTWRRTSSVVPVKTSDISPSHRQESTFKHAVSV